MKALFIQCILLAFLSFGLMAQTQKIAHKSHSGTDASFVVNVNSGNNFGLSPEVYVMHDLKQDSVKVKAFLKTERGIELMYWLEEFKEEKELTHDQFQALRNRVGTNEVGMLIEEALRYKFKDAKEYLFKIHDKNELLRKSGGFKYNKTGKYEGVAVIVIGLSVAFAVIGLYKNSSVA